jgi:GTP cyclohydrolase IA
MQEAVRAILETMGENPRREGLADTPKRVEAALRFLTRGYHQTLDDVIHNAIFDSDANHMIIVRNIEIYSLCEHHMLPFFGMCHIGYIPRGKVFGVSKVARIADMFARRLQIQENLTHQIARAMMDSIQPEGVGVIIEAKHFCMMMRGVQKQNSSMITSAMLGSFHDSPATRNEFLKLTGH